MTVARIAISLDRQLARLIQRSAAGEPTSAWLADAARRKLRAEGLLVAVSEWEQEHGQITTAELRRVRQRQRRRRPKKPR